MDESCKYEEVALWISAARSEVVVPECEHLDGQNCEPWCPAYTTAYSLNAKQINICCNHTLSDNFYGYLDRYSPYTYGTSQNMLYVYVSGCVCVWTGGKWSLRSWVIIMPRYGSSGLDSNVQAPQQDSKRPVMDTREKEGKKERKFDGRRF